MTAYYMKVRIRSKHWLHKSITIWWTVMQVMVANRKTKALISPPPRRDYYYAFGSAHDKNHNGVNQNMFWLSIKTDNSNVTT